MRTNETKFLMLILTVCLSAAWIRAQPLVEQIAPNATEIVGVTDAKISPSGKFMVLQTDVGFYVVPIERLDRLTGDIDDADNSYTEGWAKTFMPSGKILVKSRRGLYTSDPQKTGEGDEIYFASADDEEKGTYLNDGEMIVVSENLIISGDNGHEMGFNQSNIIRFDVRGGRYTRGAKITGFKNASLSPNGRYIVYEHGAEDYTIAEIYDVALDVNRRISQRFNFKRYFPKYKETIVKPLVWIAPDRFVATVDENQFEEFKRNENVKDSPAWLVLFDAASGKIVWKRQLNDINAPVNLQAISKTKAFFDNGDGLYEVALAEGKLTELPRVEGSLFVISPDKTKMAYVDENRIIVSAAASGANKKTVFELSENWEKKIRSMRWSPDEKRLLVFDEDRLLLVRLSADAQNESKRAGGSIFGFPFFCRIKNLPAQTCGDCFFHFAYLPFRHSERI